MPARTLTPRSRPQQRARVLQSGRGKGDLAAPSLGDQRPGSSEKKCIALAAPAQAVKGECARVLQTGRVVANRRQRVLSCYDSPVLNPLLHWLRTVKKTVLKLPVEEPC